ncbi:hypothetical protein BDY19DRAFT_554259 [Irpex rosettiformis]|uniref:Uncharacterized protein n=1 Tax=Irpex rosettiformis TaxID=378272 RepID=A0ACB8TQ82_9APHY|nr:hypothetical protein BDY19DRAFT_554259 [Irpex rosettiformis]
MSSTLKRMVADNSETSLDPDVVWVLVSKHEEMEKKEKEEMYEPEDSEDENKDEDEDKDEDKDGKGEEDKDEDRGEVRSEDKSEITKEANEQHYTSAWTIATMNTGTIVGVAEVMYSQHCNSGIAKAKRMLQEQESLCFVFLIDIKEKETWKGPDIAFSHIDCGALNNWLNALTTQSVKIKKGLQHCHPMYKDTKKFNWWSML